MNIFLSERIYELRKENGLTQKQLAEKVGTTADSIYSWEKGRSEPSSDYLVRLADVFDVSVDHLLGRAEQ